MNVHMASRRPNRKGALVLLQHSPVARSFTAYIAAISLKRTRMQKIIASTSEGFVHPSLDRMAFLARTGLATILVHADNLPCGMSTSIFD